MPPAFIEPKRIVHCSVILVFSSYEVSNAPVIKNVLISLILFPVCLYNILLVFYREGEVGELIAVCARTARVIGGLDSSDIFCNSDYKHFLA
jgi:hypothetical protein